MKKCQFSYSFLYCKINNKKIKRKNYLKAKFIINPLSLPSRARTPRCITTLSRGAYSVRRAQRVNKDFIDYLIALKYPSRVVYFKTTFFPFSNSFL